MYDSGNYEGCLAKAMEAFNYGARSSERDQLRVKGRYRGIGVAAYTHMCGMAPSRRLARSASIAEAGERPGQRGLQWPSNDLFRIDEPRPRPCHLAGANCRRRPAGSDRTYRRGCKATPGRSRPVTAPSTPAQGGGRIRCHVSSTRVVAKAKKIAAGMLEVDEGDVSYRAGKFSVSGTDIAPLTFGNVARMAYVGHKLPDGLEPGLDETVFYDPKEWARLRESTWPMSTSIRDGDCGYSRLCRRRRRRHDHQIPFLPPGRFMAVSCKYRAGSL